MNKQFNNNKKIILIQELFDYSGVLANSETKSNINLINTKPDGFIITDTFNDPLFPLEEPKIDTSKFYLPTLIEQFSSKYSKPKSNYLPWHYYIELIGNKYFCINTRPINLKYPLDNTFLENKYKNNITNIIIEKKINIKNMIHIKILGDSNSDVYMNNIYEIIGSLCILPIIKFCKMNLIINDNLFCINMNKDRFNIKLIYDYL
jgi:hypothetical protein